MSTPTVSHDYVGQQPAKPAVKRSGLAWKAVSVAASLRLTVVLFSLSMVLVFFGTLGMMQHSIDETMKNYFRSWIVLIELQTIADFGKVFIPGVFTSESKIPFKIPFLGGYTIGWLMFFNLASAHAVRFKLTWKRSGIFMLHAGVVVLLAGEFLTGQLAVETRMMIKEGESSRFVFHLEKHELVAIDSTNPDHDVVISVPGDVILSAGKENWVENSDVPFDVQLVEHSANVKLRDLSPGEQATATHGLGKQFGFETLPKVKGTDSEGKINYPGVFLRFRDNSGADLGVYLLSPWVEHRPQKLTIGDKTYNVAYRFKRTYKPFQVHLEDADHDVYPGTNIPKDYASTVRVEHPEQGEHGPIRIWMNHPMYYAGETYYQSGMFTDPETGIKTTTLQVVQNAAWSFPYFACALVGVGMMIHFLIRLIVFLQSRKKLQAAAARPVKEKGHVELSAPTAMQLFEKIFPFAFVGLCILMLLGRGMAPSARPDRFDLYGFGKIPVQHGGRVQPMDSLARNSLTVISSKQEFVDGTDNDRTYKGVEWLLQVWASPEKANKFRIFRCDHPEVLRLLKLDNRPGSYRYSMEEIEPQVHKLEQQANVAGKKPKEKQDHYDVKVLELAKHLEVYRGLQIRRNPGLLPKDDPKEKWLSFADVLQERAPDFLKRANEQVRKNLSVELHKDPGLMADIVRKQIGERDIDELAKQMKVTRQELLEQILDEEIRSRALVLARQQFFTDLETSQPQLQSIEEMLDAYKAKDPNRFNEAVKNYHEKFTDGVSSEDKSKVKLEAWMNFFDPFLQCAALYVGVALLAALSWLVWHDPLRKSAFYLACLTLAVHTAALLARMYIGNRPPVTNLYSSAVFIGWGALALCLILEVIYKLGVGSFVGAFVGFATMLVARFLAESGDTLEMLQAVLDTNFWLATHVTCVTMGYVATFVAGILSCVYVIGGVFTPGMRDKWGKMVGSMIYGTVCFATLLSFVGTVLGGIWADQSWGRFWGWDPKENGAVLIVIWNALILHARWAGLVKARGMAVLGVVGNMVVAWSWFGTNQLGIGLHAYGFDNRLAIGCSLFWLSQMLIVALGCIPVKYWASFAPAK